MNKGKVQSAIYIVVFLGLVAIVSMMAAALLDAPLVFYDSASGKPVGCEIQGKQYPLDKCGGVLADWYETAWSAPGWKPTDEEGKE